MRVCRGDARNRLVAGALELSDVVAVTYGPKGRSVMLDRTFGRLITRDGVTVAVEIEPEDAVAALGCQVLRHACVRVNEEAGDGTTSVAIMAGALFREGRKLVAAGIDPGELAEGIRTAAVHAIQILPSFAEPVPDKEWLYQVALHTSRRDEAVARALADACMMVGGSGMIVIEDGRSREVEIIAKSGLEIPNGWDSREFADDTWEAPICLVAVIAAPLFKFDDVASILEAAANVEGNHSLLIVSEGVYGEALQTMVTNHKKGVIKCCSVRGPGYGPWTRDHLLDIAALTQAVVVDSEAGMDPRKFQAEWLGSAQTVTVKADKSTIVSFDDAFESIQRRIRALEIRKEATDSDHDKDKLTERIAKLADGFCLLRVGGATELEAKERRGRIEDSLHAVRAALREGVVPGGGMTYFALAEVLAMEPSEDLGRAAFLHALRAPLEALVANAGEEPSVLIQRLTGFPERPWWVGWDAETREIRDFRDPPLLADPLPVIRAVIETAASAASTLLTADVAITA